MKVAQWLYDWPYPLSDNMIMNGLCSDTRLLKPGQVFIALIGWHVDGRQFIDQAIQKGASLVIAETQGKASMYEQGQTWVLNWPFLSQWVSELAARFYGNPSQDLSVIGVTGTNGKSSIAYLLSQALNQQFESKCVYSGTLGQGESNCLQQIAYGMTTPDAIEMQRLLAEWTKQNKHYVAMEVSSHGLAQGRVNAVSFKGAVFSNLSHDHLDFHGSLERYIAAKSLLFQRASLDYIVLNANDQYSESMRLAAHQDQLTVCYYGIEQSIPTCADVFIKVDHYELGVDGIQAKLTSSWGVGSITSPLLGQFNLSNLLAVLSTLCMEGVEWSQALRLVCGCQPVPGRMETLRYPGWPVIIIDYAHTPDALAKMLQTVKMLAKGAVHCVFGCGGDRDHQKRPLMGQVASHYADTVWLTIDNPRSESPQAIIDDMYVGINDQVKCYLELDRVQAIAKSLNSACQEDVVVIAGKGHELYVTPKGQKTELSDSKVVYNCIKDNARQFL